MLTPISSTSELHGEMLVMELTPEAWRLAKGRNVFVMPSPILANTYYLFIPMEKQC